jgi:hypothetical protein
VDTSRRSKPCDGDDGDCWRRLALGAGASVLLGFAGVACGASSPPVTAPTVPDGPRQPDGVVIEPPPAIPEVDERVAAGGVVALRAQLGSEAVLTVVHRLFRAFSREDAEALQAILTDDAALLGAAGARGKGTLLDQWKARVKNPSYARLAGVELVERDRIERFTYEDLGGPGAPERPPMMKRGELLVRFPIATPRVGSEQLFGDSMTLLLRRDGQTYKIAGMGEENGP